MAKRISRATAGIIAVIAVVVLAIFASQSSMPGVLMLIGLTVIGSIALAVSETSRKTGSHDIARANPQKEKRSEPLMPADSLNESPKSPEPFSKRTPAVATSQVTPKTVWAAEPSSGFKIPPPPSRLASAKWIRRGEHVDIAGTQIDCGLIYVGSRLPVSQSENDPCMIDPSLKIIPKGDYTQDQTDYWPSYSDISPSARRSYLEWLQSGRRDPRANIGYVFLFFYGLERRILIDFIADQAAVDDIHDIQEELHQLMTVYGPHSNSFERYASELLGVLHIITHPKSIYTYPLPPLPRVCEMPVVLRAALGAAVVDNAPVPPNLALAWVHSAPQVAWRTPAKRCPDEFEALFFEEYRHVYGDGLKINRNRTKLKYAYRPASSGFREAGPIKISFGDVPDVSVLQEPVKRLSAIVDRATEQLEAYSRYLGKNDDAVGSLEALLSLPFSIWPKDRKDQILGLVPSSTSEFPSQRLQDLSDKLRATAPLGRDRILQLARLLGELNVGLEPNVLAGEKIPKPDECVVLYLKGQEEQTEKMAGACRSALLTLQVSAVVAMADGHFNTAEQQHLHELVDSWEELGEAVQQRLRAHIVLLSKAPVSMASLKKKLEPLGSAEKNLIASYMAGLVNADGGITTTEIKSLEKVYKLLGLESTQVYSDVHGAAATGMMSKAKSGMDTPLPPVAKGAKPGKTNQAPGNAFVLDQEKIRQLKDESAKVSSLLASIFIEEEPPLVTTSPAHTTVDSTPESGDTEEEDLVTSNETLVLGLDVVHSSLARKLLEQAEWSRQELLDIAGDLDVMLDGALEQINEASFEHLDMPFTEGDDPVMITTEVLEKMAS